MYYNHYTIKGVEKLSPDGRSVIMGDYVFDELGDYNDVYYQKHHRNILIWQSDATVLIADYNSENYEKSKQNIENKYTFLNEPIIDEFEFVLISQNEFTIGDWEFKVCTSEDYAYPKYFRMIGFNDKDNSIAYLDFDDIDLDCIDQTMPEFIDYHFNYSFE